jgi:hypothetical protein
MIDAVSLIRFFLNPKFQMVIDSQCNTVRVRLGAGNVVQPADIAMFKRSCDHILQRAGLSGTPGYDWVLIRASSAIKTWAEDMEEVRDFIDAKVLDNEDQFRVVKELIDDIYEVIKFLNSDEAHIRNGTKLFDPASTNGLPNIMFIFKNNIVYDALLLDAATTLWKLAEAKGAQGEVLPMHTKLLLRLCQYVLVNENKSWFRKDRVAKCTMSWWNGPNFSMYRLGEKLFPYENNNVNIKALIDAIRKVSNVFNAPEANAAGVS